MFLPFSVFVGLCIRLRASVLPFLMIGHALIDFPLVVIVLGLSQ
jgi:hypothetical protein